MSEENVDIAENVESTETPLNDSRHAEHSEQHGNRSSDIKVDRYVNEVDEDLTTVNTRIIEEEQRGRTSTTTIDNTIESFDISSGDRIEHESTTAEVRTRLSGMTKRVHQEEERASYQEDGALAEIAGYDYVATSSNSSSIDERYNRKGRQTYMEIHTEHSDSYSSARRDEKARFDYDESGSSEKGIGDSERYEVKRSMRATAKEYGGKTRAHVERTTKRGNFSYTTSSDNQVESYEKTSRNRGISAKQLNGEYYGVEVNLRTEEIRELSDKEVKDALKEGRRKADRAIERVTNGELDAIDEYMYSVGGDGVEGERPPLGYVFEITPEQSINIPEAKERRREEHQESVENAKNITAEDVLRRRMLEGKLNR